MKTDLHSPRAWLIIGASAAPTDEHRACTMVRERRKLGKPQQLAAALEQSRRTTGPDWRSNRTVVGDTSAHLDGCRRIW